MKILSFIFFISIGLSADSLFATVTNIDKNDTLNVRTSPNYKSKKIGEIPLNSTIGIKECKTINNGSWCKVYPLTQIWFEKFHSENTGWVNSSFLKFSNRGYVLIDGEANCAYSLSCNNDECKVIFDLKNNELNTKLINRSQIKGESSFGATPSDADGYCSNVSFKEINR